MDMPVKFFALKIHNASGSLQSPAQRDVLFGMGIGRIARQIVDACYQHRSGP